MIETLFPPVSQYVIPSTCGINNKVVVILSEGDGASYPESGPGSVEHVACDTNDTVGEDERVLR